MATLTASAKSNAVVIGSDHGGYDLKVQISDYLKTKGFEVKDVGCHTATRCDYPDIAGLAGRATLDGSNALQRGIVVCGSGIGISIAAIIADMVCHYLYRCQLGVCNAKVMKIIG